MATRAELEQRLASVSAAIARIEGHGARVSVAGEFERQQGDLATLYRQQASLESRLAALGRRGPVRRQIIPGR